MTENIKKLDDLYQLLNDKLKLEVLENKKYIRSLLRELITNDDTLSVHSTHAEYELLILNTSIKKGVVKKEFCGFDYKGDKIENPPAEKIDEYCSYIIQRLLTVDNPILIAKYNHILWQYKINNNYAKKSVDSYFDSIELLKQNKNLKSIMIDYVENLFYICNKIKYRKDDILHVIIELISSIESDDDKLFSILYNVLKIINDNVKVFRHLIDNIILEMIFNKSKAIYSKKMFENASLILIEGEKLSRKLDIYGIEWDEEIAKSYEHITNNNGMNFVALESCRKSIDFYKKSNNAEKQYLLEQKYEEISDKMRFTKSEFSIDMKDFFNECKNFANKINLLDSNDILSGFANELIILPNHEYVTKQGKENFENLITHKICNTAVFDSRGNTVKKLVTDDEKKNYEFLKTYGFSLDLQMIRNDIIINKAISSGKLDFDILINYLMNTWLNEPMRISSGTGA